MIAFVLVLVANYLIVAVALNVFISSILTGRCLYIFGHLYHWYWPGFTRLQARRRIRK
jgi:hypothetical protein